MTEQYSKVSKESVKLAHKNESFHVVWLHFGLERVSLVDSFKTLDEAMDNIDEMLAQTPKFIRHVQTYCLYEREL